MSSTSNRTLCVFRVSKDGLVLENQRLGVSAYVDKLPEKPQELHIVGSTFKKKIPELEQLLRDVRAGKFDELVFYSVCRTGRDHLYDVMLWRTCEETGTRLRYIANGIDSHEPNSKIIFNFLSTMGEVERENISMRTKAGIRRAKQQAADRGEALDWHCGKPRGCLSHDTLKHLKHIRIMLGNDCSFREIAEVYHVSFSTIRKIKCMSDTEVDAYVKHGNDARKMLATV